MEHLLTTMMRTPPPGQPPSSYLTPPGSSDDPGANQQPLDFSLANKRPRPSSVTPILSVPAPPQPRRLLSDTPPLNSLNSNSLNNSLSNSLNSPPSLPRAPLPLNFLQQNIQSPLPTGFPPSPMVSPFLLNPSLLLQMMTSSSASASSSSFPPQAPASPPQTPASGSAATDKTELLRVNSESLGQYALFRQNMLRQLADKKTVSRRDSSDSNEASHGAQEATGQDVKDQAYWERRRKNNLAAKRSRDARRAKEDEIAIRAAFLEQENIQLKWELARLKSETARLRAMLLSDADSEDMTDLNDLTSS